MPKTWAGKNSQLVSFSPFCRAARGASPGLVFGHASSVAFSFARTFDCFCRPKSYFEPMRVLAVEDDKKIASFVVNGLKQNGFAVDHAADGEEALLLAQTVSYDAAVVDIMLPKRDGLSLVQAL